jgi:uncharacterized LabA/DUF88 family protein
MDVENRIAVLIDADNISSKYIKSIFDELSKYGIPTYKRIYGDWTRPQMASWKEILLQYSLTPIQQYSYTTGKNATDAALIIDAMDILYSGNVDGFCLVSSDSDFTKLASRLREAGMRVIGMGEKKTPPPFIAACELFKYLEVLEISASEFPAEDHDKKESEGSLAVEQGMLNLDQVKAAMKSIIDEISEDDGWAFMGTVGAILTKRFPDFDTRNYGYKKLSPFVQSMKEFEVMSRKSANPNTSLMYVRNAVGKKRGSGKS